MKDSVINMYGLFNLILWALFVMAAGGEFGEPLSPWFFPIPFLFSIMYAGSVYKTQETK